MQRLEILKALGDNTRYAIYLEIARSSSPKATAEIADMLGLHPNTIRPHLERMREVGLLVLEIDGRGSVGRPQHRYRLAADAPSLGLEPPAYTALAGMLAAVARQARPAAEELWDVGRAEGRAFAQHSLGAAAVPPTNAAACLRALTVSLETLGFDPASVDGDDGASTTIAFAHCPYRELAEAYPEMVCELHRGMIEGVLDAANEAVLSAPTGADEVVLVERFHTLSDRTPCQVDLVTK